MLKIIPAIIAAIVLGALGAMDYMGFKHRSHELAALADANVLTDVSFDAEHHPSYFNHLLSRFGISDGLPEPSVALAKAERAALRTEALNSYLPTPDEDILPGWERIGWNASYQTGFGWPDGVEDPYYNNPSADLDHEVAIYLKGKSSVYVRVEYSEPTEALAKRLKQSYWVVETGRDLSRLIESKPRASYFWTNIEQSSKGASVANAKDIEYFEKINGVHFVTAKSKAARRDEKMRYVFASLGGGVVIKVRAHASEPAIKSVLEQIDFQNLNQLQTLPSPLIAEGLNDIVIDTPEHWLADHGFTDQAEATPAKAKASAH